MTRAASRVAGTVIAGVAIVGLVGVGIVALRQRTDTATAADDTTPVVLSTVQIEQRDLVTYDETTATLGFTTSVTVTAPVAGTVTSIVAAGEQLQAGSVVATIDGTPVVSLIGDIPGYRDLSEDSSDGPDIRQLEMNLVTLGFDPDHAIEIDEEFDDATADAVTAWEDSLGLEGDGEVPAGQVAFVTGDLLVDTVSADVGSTTQVGTSLLTARQSARRFLVPATVSTADAADRTVDRIVAVDTPVVPGTVLFWQDGVPVVAAHGDQASLPALARDLSLGVVAGADVELLETMLVATGFDPDATMTIDDTYDDATAATVVRWYTSFGLTVDANPVVAAGSIVVVPDGLVAGTPMVEGDPSTLVGDAVVLSLTSPPRQVSTTAPIGDETFALDAVIDVEFPDGTIEPGRVVAVGNVASNASDVPGATPTVSIDLVVDDIPASVESFVEVPVTLRVVADSAPASMVVPVSALVALAEGGFAIEVVSEAGTTGLVAVEPGLFVDGFVAITGDGLTTGQSVVVPS